jgi:hypothetical protein
MSHFSLKEQPTLFTFKIADRIRKNKSMTQGQCVPSSVDNVKMHINHIINLQIAICVAENAEHNNIFHATNTFYSVLNVVIITDAIFDVLIMLMYWIYFLPSTQQTIGCNGFYNDMFRLPRIIVRLCSEPFGFSTIVTYSSGGCWSV